MTARIRDVAAKAGVSTATVSYVLNGTRGTRAETRERVLAAIEELGYSQNQAARDLARGRSSLLGLVISDIRNPFFPEVTAGFQDQALLHQMDALVVNTNYDATRTLNSVRRLLSLQVPGVALLTSQIDPAVIEMLAERGVAAVYLDLGRVDRAISNIAIDYEQGIEQALDHLTRLGHREIGYIGGPLHLPSAARRKRAFQEIAARMGIGAGHTIDSDFTPQGGYAACSQMLAGPGVSAILAANDLTAIGVLHRAHDAGIGVPAQISVVGFDDISIAAYSQPSLTTVAVPREEIGRAAFEALWAMIEDPDLAGREYGIATRLITRASSARHFSG